MATGDRSYLEDLKKCCDLLSKRVTEKGTMGHHYSIPYSAEERLFMHGGIENVWFGPKSGSEHRFLKSSAKIRNVEK